MLEDDECKGQKKKKSRAGKGELEMVGLIVWGLPY